MSPTGLSFGPSFGSSSGQALSRTQIRTLFKALNAELAREDHIGELYLVGGAVMCLVFAARPASQDVEAIFRPSAKVREAAARVTSLHNLRPDWLINGVQRILSPKAEFDDYLSLPNLHIFVARPEYLLAMKCLSMRLGPELHDESDVRYLLRNLNITNASEAMDIITRYYPLEGIPQKTLYALEEILDVSDSMP